MDFIEILCTSPTMDERELPTLGSDEGTSWHESRPFHRLSISEALYAREARQHSGMVEVPDRYSDLGGPR